MLLKTFQRLRWIVVGLAAVVLSHLAIVNTAAHEWSVITQLPTHRTGFSTVVVDGKIYLIGGTLFGNDRRGPFGMSLVEVYDPETNSWERLADMPTARSDPKMAVVDGKIYVLAGYAGKDRGMDFKFLNVAEMYDPETDTWVRNQDMPTPRIQFGVGVVAGKIYTIGGLVDPKKPEDPWRVDLVEVYDPISDTWAKRAKMPTKRDGVRAAVIRDIIYAIGGAGWPQIGAGGPSLGTIEAYEPRINRWTKKPDMPNLRAGFSIVVIGDKIYLIGGFDVQVGGIGRGQQLTSIEVYEPVTEKWRLIPTTPTVEHPFGVVAVNGKIYVFGGYTEDSEFLPAVEVFDTGFRAVTAIGKLPTRWGALKMEHQSQP